MLYVTTAGWTCENAGNVKNDGHKGNLGYIVLNVYLRELINYNPEQARGEVVRGLGRSLTCNAYNANVVTTIQDWWLVHSHYS